MSRSASSTINFTLTAYAQGRMNDLLTARAVANALCPIVPASGAAGQFKTFDDKNSFQTYNTGRGLGGTARRIAFAASDDAFNCTPQALEVTVDQHERDLAGINNPLAQQLLDEGKIRALLNATALSHVKKVVDFVGDNTTALVDRGNWSNKDIDPIDQLDEQLEALVTAVGSSTGITLTIGLTALRKLRSNANVKARARGVKVGDVTVEDIRSMLMIPVDIVVGALSYNTAKEGQAVSKALLAGSIAYLSYSVPNPTIYDPSPFKCFTTGSNMIESVRTYRDPSERFDVHAIDWSEDIKQTSTLGIKRFDVI